MRQRVKTVSYLARAEFELKNGVYDLVALPAGAEVVKVSLEMVNNSNSVGVSIGFKDEVEKDYFLPLNIVVNKNESIIINRDYTAVDNKVIVAEIKQTTPSEDAKGVLRVVYFLPSETEVEY